MGKKRAREADGAEPADNSVDKMDEDSSDEEVSTPIRNAAQHWSSR